MTTEQREMVVLMNGLEQTDYWRQLFNKVGFNFFLFALMSFLFDFGIYLQDRFCLDTFLKFLNGLQCFILTLR